MGELNPFTSFVIGIILLQIIPIKRIKLLLDFTALYLNKKKPYTGILYRTLPDFVSFIAQNIFDMIAGVPHRSNAHIVAWFQAFHDRECLNSNQ